MQDQHELFQEYVKRRTVAPPAILYRYMTVDGAIATLESMSARFNSPLRFNDPFDCQWDCSWQMSSPAAIARQDELLRGLLNGEPFPDSGDPRLRQSIAQWKARIDSLPVEEREAAITREAADREFLPDTFRREIEAAWADIHRRLRILCLTERPDSLLMWSHYASDHCGVVLGFRSRPLEHHWSVPVERVRYSEEFPEVVDLEGHCQYVIHGVPEPKPLIEYSDLALYKCVDWQYEREWRFATIAPRGTAGLYTDCSLVPGSLESVYFGCRFDEASRDRIRRAARKISPDVRLLQMMRNGAMFGLNSRAVVGSSA